MTSSKKPAATKTDKERVEEMATRLDEVDEHIKEARRGAEHAGLMPDHEPRYVDSGTVHPELDDQTIAPPG